MSCTGFTIDRRLKHWMVAVAAIGSAWAHGQVTVRAHHTAMNLSVPAPGCGWAEGDSVRDRNNVSEFCLRWVPPLLGIRMAVAVHAVVQIEASPALIAALHDDRRSVAALLRDWLQHWRRLSGYKSASIVLTRNHIEIAKIYTTMAGDVVAIR
jgi:hypothetical protein